jgi:pSer/pThr/pTyr-binding forkhead associated (FHA) protein
MPITVLVRSASGDAAGEGAPSLTFDGPRVVLGRGQGSDVRLPDPSVSTRHATIRAQGTEYAVVDEGSTNGTWVGGIRLLPQTPRVVKSGDLVRVGRVWLEIAVGHKAATPDLGLATRDLALALVKRAMDAVGDDTVATVRVAEGPDLGAVLRLVDEGRAFVLGRAETCDLPLSDPDASREHAVVTRRGGQVLLRDLGSRNGVSLGETRLTPDRDVVWKPPVMARIGRSVLALDEPVSVALAELEAAVDEPMRDEEAPPEPPASVAHPPGAGGAAPPDGLAPSSSSGGAATGDEPAPSSKHVPSLAGGPIAEVAVVPQPLAPRRRRAWTMTDVLVVLFAVAVIGASVAGLVWVLK